MAGSLQGKKIAFMATTGMEQIEYTEPRKAVEQAGAQAELVSLESGKVRAWKHFDDGDSFPVDKTVEQANADDYDALVLPGGVANPDQLRTNPKAVAFARAFFESGKPDAHRRRRGQGQDHHLLAEPEDRPAQRRRELGRRGVRRRLGHGLQPQAGRPASLLRQDRRGVRRGRPPGPGGQDQRAELTRGGARRRGSRGGGAPPAGGPLAVS